MHSMFSRVVKCAAVAAAVFGFSANAPAGGVATFEVQGYTGSETLAEFPVLVRISESTVPNLHEEAADGGADLRFFDAAGNALAHEIDTWNPGGESLVWVKLPTLSSGTTFTLRWGEVGSEPANDPTAVWSAYVGVWHMNEPDGAVADATGHGLTATPTGNTENSIAVSGAPTGTGRQTAAAAAVQTAEGKGHLSIPSYDSFALGSSFSISAWMLKTGSVGYQRPISRKKFYRDADGWETEMKQNTFNNITARGANEKTTVTASALPSMQDTWVHLALTYRGDQAVIYANGESKASGKVATPTDNGLPLALGNNSNGSEAGFMGAFDEVRLARTSTSADWTKAEYESMSKSDFVVCTGIERGGVVMSFTGLSVNDDGSVRLAWSVASVRSGVTAQLKAQCGTTPDDLSQEIDLGALGEPGDRFFDLANLVPDRTYYVRLSFAVGDDTYVVGTQSILLTLPEGGTDAELAWIVPTVIENRTGGVVTSHDVTFDISPTMEIGTLAVYAAYGKTYGGGAKTGWANVVKVGDVTAGSHSVRFDLPSGWGSSVRYLRYFVEAPNAGFVFHPVEFLASLDQVNLPAKTGDARQYIDTGVRVQQGETLEVVWRQAAPALTAEDKGWGAGQSTAISFGGRRSAGKLTMYAAGGNRVLEPEFPASDLDNDLTTVYCDRVTVAKTGITLTMTKRDDPTCAWTATSGTATFTQTDRDLYLFMDSSQGGSYEYAYPGVKAIYGAKMTWTDSGERVFELVPGLKDGVPGMMNLVNGEFLTCPNAAAAPLTAGEPVELTLKVRSATFFAAAADQPELDALAVSGMARGDTLTVAGTVLSGGAGSVSLAVEVSSDEAFADVATTPIAGSFATGDAFSQEVAVAAGAAFWVRVRATGASGTALSDPVAVQMVGAPTVGAVTTAAEGRTVTVTVPVTALGANTTKVWVEWTQGDASGKTEVAEHDWQATGVTDEFVVSLPVWAVDAAFEVKVESSCTSETWTRTSSKTQAPVDKSAYVWKSDVSSGNWCDPANWTTDSSDAFGWPNGASAGATFPAGGPYGVTLDADVVVGDFKLESGADLTLSGARKLTVSNYRMTGTETDWSWTISDGAQVLGSSSFPTGGASERGNALHRGRIAVSGAGSVLRAGRFEFAGEGVQFDLTDGASFGCTVFCFGGEGSVMRVDDAVIANNNTFWFGDRLAYDSVPPECRISSANGSVTVASVGSGKNAGSVASVYAFDVPATGFADVPLKMTDNSNLPHSAGWKVGGSIGFRVEKTSPFVLNGRGTLDQQLVNCPGGIVTDRISLGTLPRGSSWYYTYDKTAAREGEKVTGLWVHLEARNGMIIFLR